MTRELQDALLRQAELAGLVDTDLLASLPEFVKDQESIKTDADVRNAVHRWREQHPALFRPTDWTTIPEGPAYDEAEASFRQNLRRSRPMPANEFQGLDAARLDESELESLTRYVVGRRNSYDRAILTRALGRQKAEDAGGAA
jgi:hypothetical protein